MHNFSNCKYLGGYICKNYELFPQIVYEECLIYFHKNLKQIKFPLFLKNNSSFETKIFLKRNEPEKLNESNFDISVIMTFQAENYYKENQ